MPDTLSSESPETSLTMSFAQIFCSHRVTLQKAATQGPLLRRWSNSPKLKGVKMQLLSTLALTSSVHNLPQGWGQIFLVPPGKVLCKGS